MSGGGGAGARVGAVAGDREPRVLKIRGCDVRFPHKPYPSQLAMMDKTLQALKNAQNVLLELPTGSGKSLSLLCAAAAWHEGAVRELAQASADTHTAAAAVSCKGDDDAADAADAGEAAGPRRKREKPKRPPKVYIASRTHAQLAQLVRELRKSGYNNVHMQVLGSREQYCINTAVLKSDQPKAQACKDLVNKNACRYMHGAPRLEKHERLQEGGDLRIHDIEVCTQTNISCVYASLHAHTHTHAHVHTRTHARTRAHSLARTRTHRHARARAHTHTHTLSLSTNPRLQSQARKKYNPVP